jgi:hypothetical protein
VHLGLLLADGIYMMEVDRVLRPGGYWVLSGPPIHWKANYKAWQRPKEDLEEEQRKIEEVAKLLCWEKKTEKNEIAVWQKTVDSETCRSRQEDSGVKFCESTDADDVWYVLSFSVKHLCILASIVGIPFI